MCAATDDLTAAARIRRAAMKLFAERGFEDASIRDIAAEAGVSSSLVVHHFKSKAGLRAATDARAVALIAEMLAELPAGEAEFGEAARSFAEAFTAEPGLLAYLRRMLVDGGEASAALFSGLVDATATELSAQERAGVLRPSSDPRIRAAFVIVNDLGAVILRDLIEQAIGIDPLSSEGLSRWGEVVMDVYTRGIYLAENENDRPASRQRGRKKE